MKRIGLEWSICENFPEFVKETMSMETEEQEDSINQIKRQCRAKALLGVLENELTEKQRFYFLEHYLHGFTVREIAEEAGVDRSTVFRTIQQAKDIIYRFLRYYI